MFRGFAWRHFPSCSWSRSSTLQTPRNNSSESLAASTKQTFGREEAVGDDDDRGEDEMQLSLSPPSLHRRGTFAVSSDPGAAPKSASDSQDIPRRCTAGVLMVWCSVVWHGMICMVWCGIVWYGTASHGIVWHSMVWYCNLGCVMVWYGMVRYCAYLVILWNGMVCS